jgi:hypothetical protein
MLTAYGFYIMPVHPRFKHAQSLAEHQHNALSNIGGVKKLAIQGMACSQFSSETIGGLLSSYSEKSLLMSDITML